MSFLPIPTTSTTAESALLFACATSALRPGKAEAIPRLARKVNDWERLVEMAERNYVIPLIYRALAEVVDSEVPPRVLNTLRVRSKMIAWRNTLFCDELTRMEGILRPHGIRVIHYKGPVIARLLYGDESLRTYNDLDFLVKRGDLSRLLDLLRDGGYKQKVEYSDHERVHHEREFKEYKLTAGPLTLEPHFNITSRNFPFDIDYDALWTRAQRVSVKGTEVLTLSPADLLLVLAVVGGKGRWKRLQMVCDIAEFLKTYPEMDWEKLVVDARNSGSERMLLTGLSLAHELLESTLPEEMLRRIGADRTVGRLTPRIVSALVKTPREPYFLPNSPRTFSSLLFAMRERLRDRFIYAWGTVTTPTLLHMKRMPLPRALFPLYRVLTPLHDYVVFPAVRFARAIRHGELYRLRGAD